MKETKGIIRVPTKTQYAFIEMHLEGSPKEMVDAYNELNEAYWGQGEAGVPSKDFNAFVDNMLLGEDNHVEQLEPMSEKQKFVVNEIKKALKRIKNKA